MLLFLRGTTRGIIFKRTQDFIHSSFDESLSIKILCQEIGINERTLRHAFTEKSGLSPKKYIHNFRLNKARKLLKSGRYEKVIDVADQLGFWHSGQFASDYRNLFSENPSETMKL